ncbi:MAG: hypothetical protein IJR03_07455 [Bacteroidales bacterium]|nr:hypothetical protein [Bacteroidales bacterium]
MKRIFLWKFIFMIMLLGGNSFCSAQSNVEESIQRKTKEKETVYITVTADKVKDTIASMEKDGWVYEGMVLNSDRTWTITMSRWTSSKSKRFMFYGEDEVIPDGTYYTDYYPYHGRMIRVEIVYKDGKEISRKKIIDD